MSKYFPTPDECSSHTIFPGVEIRTTSGEKMMVSIVEIAPHAVVEEHAHPHEQVGVLLSGKVQFFIGDEQKTVNPGDVWVIPGGVRHKVIGSDVASRTLDVFMPIREDYR